MLKGLCQYVLIGHSERRVHFRETEWVINRKVQAALRHGLKPVLCVGENADQLEHGEGPLVVGHQLEADLKGVTLDSRVVIAYDPVWATMGRAEPPTARDIDDMCGCIRETLGELSTPQAAGDVRVLYGGTVTPRNAAEVSAQPEIDGALVGSAGLRAADFAAIVSAFAHG